MSIHASQWTSVLGHYGASAYQTTEVSPTNTSPGQVEMRSPPPAYSITARNHTKPGPSPSLRPRPRPTRRNSTAVAPPTQCRPASVRPRAGNTRLSPGDTSQSLSLAFNTSTSSSGTDDLESPPIETENDNATDNEVSIRTSDSRPSMRHFPSVTALSGRGQSNSGSEEDEDEADYPRRMPDRDNLVGKPVSRKYMTTGPVKSKGPLRLDNWWNTSGRKGSKLMSKLKSGGSKLSRLFSSDGEMASGGSGSSDGQEAEVDQADMINPRTASEIIRRPSLVIDLSTVPTLQTELQTALQDTQPRIPTPSFVLGRHGFSRYNPLPTIVGSPSIAQPLSPVEIFHTPPTGLSPVFPAGFPTATTDSEEGPRSLVGLFQTPLAGPALTTRSSEATLVSDAMITPKESVSETMGLEGALNNLSTEFESTTPPVTEVTPSAMKETVTGAEDQEVNLSIFSPRVHYTPVLLPVLGSPMCSPLELPSLDSPARGSLLGLGSGSMMLSNSASRSHCSNGSIRIKIDGCPMTASLSSMAAALVQNDIAGETTMASTVPPSEEKEPETPTKPLLPRASVDVNANRPIFSNQSQIQRQSLPNITTLSPTSPQLTFSPLLGASPRLPDSPHFTRPDFGPVSTPPSLIANPRSLGDPFPNGLPSDPSRNLAACANPEEIAGLGHLRRRSSGRIIDRYARGPLSPPRKVSALEIITPKEAKSVEAIPMDNSKMEAKSAVPLNPYFG
jgi:hypothetical protein